MKIYIAGQRTEHCDIKFRKLIKNQLLSFYYITVVKSELKPLEHIIKYNEKQRLCTPPCT